MTQAVQQVDTSGSPTLAATSVIPVADGVVTNVTGAGPTSFKLATLDALATYFTNTNPFETLQGALDAVIQGYLASGSNAAANDLTIKAPTSTGNATPGTLIFQAAPVGSSGSTAQTQATQFTIDATALTFVTKLVSATALATPSALAATAFNAFASTVSGATLMGFGTTHDVTLKNRAGTTALGIGANSTNVWLKTLILDGSDGSLQDVSLVRRVVSATGATFKSATDAEFFLSIFSQAVRTPSYSLGQLEFEGLSTTSASVNYASIQCVVADNTNGSEDASLDIKVMIAGSSTSVLNLTGTTLTTPNAFTATAGPISAGGSYRLVGTPSSPGGSVRYIGTNGSATVWSYNVPTGGSHLLSVNDVSAMLVQASAVTLPGNLLIGGSVGATAAKTVALSNSATSPTTSVDLCHLFSLDISAGHASLAIYSEEVTNAAVGVASTHRYPVTINGTQYAILLTTVLA